MDRSIARNERGIPALNWLVQNKTSQKITAPLFGLPYLASVALQGEIYAQPAK